MQTDEILDIRAFADLDIIDITTRYDARPEARETPDAYIARQENLRCDKSLFMDLRLLAWNSFVESVYIGPPFLAKNQVSLSL